MYLRIDMLDVEYIIGKHRGRPLSNPLLKDCFFYLTSFMIELYEVDLKVVVRGEKEEVESISRCTNLPREASVSMSHIQIKKYINIMH